MSIILLLENFALLEKSRDLKLLDEQFKKEKITITFISISGEIFYIGKPLSIESLKSPLIVENENQFIDRIEKLKDIKYYGHFKLPSETHLRTFIDVLPIVEDEYLNPYIIKKIEEIKANKDFDLVIGFGLCTKAVYGILVSLKQRYENEDINIFFSDYRCTDGSLDEKEDEDLDNILKIGNKRVLIITDVIYTARTVTEIVKILKSKGTEVTNIFSILGILKSPSSIYVNHDIEIDIKICAKLELDFYADEGSCNLCKIKYPSHEGRTIKNYTKIPELPVLPYEFWYMVKETKALETDYKVLHNGRSHYLDYINTLKVFKKYDDWIAYLIYKEIKRKIFNYNIINCFVHPNEDSSKFLSLKLRSKFKHPDISRVSVNRDDITNTLPDEIDELTKEKYKKLSGKRVLIIDDGVNTLRTYFGLQNIIKLLGGTLMGTICFINRLSQITGDRFKDELKNNLKIPFIYFYHYPSPPWDQYTSPIIQENLVRNGS